MDNAEIIILTLEDGTDLDCEVIGVFDVEDKDYIALAPKDGSEDVYLYGYDEKSETDFDLIDIEDDETFDKVSAEFYRLMETDGE